MTERPILFSAPMVRAILDGTKTQTRRVAKKMVRHPDLGNLYTPGALVLEGEPQHVIERACPYGQPGDRLWVRETWAPLPMIHSSRGAAIYRATDDETPDDRWRPSIHMPRWASRITLEVTGVRVERLQDISEADSIAEGIEIDAMPGDSTRLWRNYLSGGTTVCPAYSYQTLWEQINGPDSWATNPWVWVLEFKRMK